MTATGGGVESITLTCNLVAVGSVVLLTAQLQVSELLAGSLGVPPCNPRVCQPRAVWKRRNVRPLQSVLVALVAAQHLVLASLLCTLCVSLYHGSSMGVASAILVRAAVLCWLAVVYALTVCVPLCHSLNDQSASTDSAVRLSVQTRHRTIAPSHHTAHRST